MLVSNFILLISKSGGVQNNLTNIERIMRARAMCVCAIALRICNNSNFLIYNVIK